MIDPIVPSDRATSEVSPDCPNRSARSSRSATRSSICSLTTSSTGGGINLTNDTFSESTAGSGGAINLNGATLKNVTLSNSGGQQLNVTGDSTLTGNINWSQYDTFNIGGSNGAHTLNLNTAGTTAPGVTEAQLVDLIRTHFKLTPKGIIESLDLRRPIYKETARHGHFGRELETFSWEKTDKVAALRKECPKTEAA